ncbi:MAG: hypothetical protein DRI90_20000 [Deltaproteobacteria bacterium]|nr:MAG: hypothetical protein DRI90_20000 [Deltaproteobacteria bacterium]
MKTSTTRHWLRGTGLLLLGLTVMGCGYRPTRFADRPPVTDAQDDHGIARPTARTFIKELHQADVYVRRELVGGLDPRRSPAALDVNSLDEVPRSSWFRPPADSHHPLADYPRDGPPKPPFTITGEAPTSGMEDALVIVDARGLPYELQPDVPGHPGMRSGAAAIASRLFHALGYRTAEVHIIRSHEGERVAATRWPLGVDLGPTPINDTRSDDSNDQLPHLQRRSLRALTMMTGWLGLKRLRSRNLRDVYLGQPGLGHVQHVVAGLDGALGVDDYLDERQWVEDPDREDSNFFLRVFSLGLSPKPPAVQPDKLDPAVGMMNERVLKDHYDPSPPFEPRDHLLPGDAYWAAKRIAAVDRTAIAAAIQAAKLEPLAENWLFQVLMLRRDKVIAKGFNQTTPCEVITIEPPVDKRGARLVLANLAVEKGVHSAAAIEYQISYLASDGEPVAKSRRKLSPGPIVTVPLPAGLSAHDYLVVRVVAQLGTDERPPAFEVHLKSQADTFRLLGVRH